jgi:hypothetical protein
VAQSHIDMKNQIIHEMSSLYPEKPWEFDVKIRDKFLISRGERELDLMTLNKILDNLKSEKKGCKWAHELNHRLENWNWKH